MVLRRSREEIRTVNGIEGGKIGKVLLEMVPASGLGAAEAMVRAVLKGWASAACCQQICGLKPCGCATGSALCRGKFECYGVNKNPLVFIRNTRSMRHQEMTQHWLPEVNALMGPGSENTCICLSRLMLWIKPAGLESLKS